MRAVRASVRAFVHGTEDEERVVAALVDVLGRAGDPQMRGRLTRSRIRAHHGGEILSYEAVLRTPKDLRAFFEGLRAASGVAPALRAEFDDRLDADRVLHFRLDQQEAIGGRRVLGSGGDAFDVQVKFATQPGEPRQGFPFD